MVINKLGKMDGVIIADEYNSGYLFCVNNPLNYQDELGLKCAAEKWKLAGAFTAAVGACSAACIQVGANPFADIACAAAFMNYIGALKSYEDCMSK